MHVVSPVNVINVDTTNFVFNFGVVTCFFATIFPRVFLLLLLLFFFFFFFHLAQRPACEDYLCAVGQLPLLPSSSS